jgi:hypothetical protein
VRHSRAAVVTGDREAGMAERGHHLDLVQRQRAFRIVDKILAAGGFELSHAVARVLWWAFRRTATQPSNQ